MFSLCLLAFYLAEDGCNGQMMTLLVVVLQALAANAAALAAAAAGQNGFGGLNSGGMLNSMEYQAAYQVGLPALLYLPAALLLG